MDVQQTGIQDLGTGKTVLGERQTRIPVGGKIRGGIKVLTQTAAKHKDAPAIYAAGVKAGRTFGQIEKELMEKCKFEKSPLTPRNVPYFTVRHADFTMPEVADAIMKLYASDRGDGPHLYRFPIIFPVDNWAAVMPHGLNCYTRSEKIFWSEYGADGKRYCKTRGTPQIVGDDKAKRAVRPFGGRPVVLRAENDGLCVPENCKEYQNRQCNLTGSFLFYIQGIPGSSAIELPTTSFYSMQQARQKLEMVSFITGGRISGTLNGKPIFYITKKQEEVSMLDPETGKPKKVKQWLIGIEADIDMTKIFQAGEARIALPAGEAAAAALEHLPDPDETGEETAAVIAEPEAKPAETPVEKTDDEKIKAAKRELKDLLDTVGINTDIFIPYAKRTWGEKWAATNETLRKAIDDVKAGRDLDIDKYISRVGEPF